MDSTNFGGPGGEISSFASPLEEVFRRLPKAHEKPLRQAVYIVLAVFIFAIISYGSYYVVFVLLWPFFLPIMWALMTGLVIHPYKTWLADAMRQAFVDMAACENTSIVALACGVVNLFDSFCEFIGGYVVAKWKMLTAVAVVFAVAHISIVIDPAVLASAFGVALNALSTMMTLASMFKESRNLIVTAAASYLVSVIIFWTPDRNRIFKFVSYFLWMWVFVYFLNFVTFLYAIAVFVAFKIFFRSSATDEDQTDGSKESPRSKRSKFREYVFAVLKGLQDGVPTKVKQEDDVNEVENGGDNVDGKIDDAFDEKTVVQEPLPYRSFLPTTYNGSKVETESKSEKADPVTATTTPASVGHKQSRSKAETEVTPIPAKEVPLTPILAKQNEKPLPISSAKIEHPGVSAIRRFHMQRLAAGVHNVSSGSEAFSSPYHKMINSTPASTRQFRKHYRTVLSRGVVGSTPDGSNGQSNFVKESDLYISLVTGCFVVVQLWQHPILLHLLPIPIGYSLVKRWLLHFRSPDQFKDIGFQFLDFVSDWIETRLDAVVPAPARFVWRELGRLKRAVLKALPKYSDTIATTILIAACIVLFVFVVVFVSLQIYAESLYLVQIGGRVFAAVANSSLYNQLNTTGYGDAINNNTYTRGLEDAIDSAYHYGRDYISSTVVSMLGETRDRAAVQDFETKLLELWDRIYQYWLSSRTGPSTSTTTNIYGPHVSQEAIATSAEEVLQRLINIDDFNFSSVSHFAVNNMGTLTSVLEQGWVLVMSNASFALGVVTEIFRILFLSGYGMVNFIFCMAVYFSALFYLLKVEGPVYKPVEVISSYGHLVGDGFASALNKAVNSVFTLTAKMAYFYGVWTYVTHTVFHASIVTVPVLAAAFLAAVPVAGQYLVALPAAMELWLAEDRWGSAVALVACHALPPYVVDAAIYSEVRHGIHPWITGLSIVGGVYCFGIPGGAIYGPVILCIVYVIWTMIMYTGLFDHFGFVENNWAGKSKMAVNTPHLKRSESIY